MSNAQYDAYISNFPGTPPLNKPLGEMDARELNNLPVVELQSLPTSVFADAFGGSTPHFQPSDLNYAQALNLTPAQLATLSAAQISALVTMPVALRSGNDITALLQAANPSDANAFMAALSMDTVSMLNVDQIIALLPQLTSLNGISGSKLNVLMALGALNNVSTNVLATLNDQDLLLANDWVKSSLSSRNIAWTTTQFQALAITGPNLRNSINRNVWNFPAAALAFQTARIQNVANVRFDEFGEETREDTSVTARSDRAAKAFGDYKNLITSTRKLTHGFMLASQALNLSAAVSLFYLAAAERGSDPARATSDEATAIWYLANNTRIASTVMLDAYIKYKGETPTGRQLLAQIMDSTGRSWMRSWFDLIRANPKAANGVGDTTALFQHSATTPKDPVNAFKASDLGKLDKNWRGRLATGVFSLFGDIALTTASIEGMLVQEKYPELKALNDWVWGIDAAFGGAATISDLLVLMVFNDSAKKAVTNIMGAAWVAGALALYAQNLGTDIIKLQHEPSQGKVITLACDAVFSVGINAVLTLAATTGPVGMAVLTLYTLLLPNFRAIGQAVDFRNQAATYNAQGRTELGSLYYMMRDIAAVEATPLVNIFALGIAESIRTTHYADMAANNYTRLLTLLRQEFAYAAGNDSQTLAFIQNLRGIVKDPANQGKVQNFIVLNLDTVGTADYLASDDAHNLQKGFISWLGISNSGNVFTNVEWQSTVININAQELAPDTPTTSLVSLQSARPMGVGTATVDARGSTRALMFLVGTTAYRILGGSGINTYRVEIANEAVPDVYITGGSSGKDQVIFVATQDITIRMDDITNVDYVQGAEVNNTVLGNAAHKNYRWGGQVDSVALLGGYSKVTIGGWGCSVTMGGGNNLVRAVLGYLPQGNGAVARYDGGASTMTPTYTGTGSPQVQTGWSGMNLLDFSSSLNGLKLYIQDPQADTLSLVEAVDDKDALSDRAVFTHFQQICGSNMGDTISVQHCSNLYSLSLGMGDNTVDVDSSRGLYIHAGQSTNQISLHNMSSAMVNSQAGDMTIYLNGGSSLAALLAGSSDYVEAIHNTDNLSADDVAQLALTLTTGDGTHVINAGNQACSVTMDSAAMNNTTLFIENTVRSDVDHLLQVKLAGDPDALQLSLVDDHRLMLQSTDASTGALQKFTYKLQQGQTWWDGSTLFWERGGAKAVASSTLYVALTAFQDITHFGTATVDLGSLLLDWQRYSRVTYNTSFSLTTLMRDVSSAHDFAQTNTNWQGLDCLQIAMLGADDFIHLGSNLGTLTDMQTKSISAQALKNMGNAVNGFSMRQWGIFGTAQAQAMGAGTVHTGTSACESLTSALAASTLAANSLTANDTYLFSRNGGADTITDAGGSDTLRFLQDINYDQLWFKKSGSTLSDLEIDVLGSSDKVTISNWFNATSNAQIEKISTSDGKVLNSTDVQSLVQAMSTMTAPSASNSSNSSSTSSSSLSTTDATTLNRLAVWH
jgi:hypothetical protein